MRKTSKFAAILLSLILCVISIPLAAMAEEAPVITMLVSGDNETPPDDCIIGQAVKERSGVNFQPIFVSSNDFSQKLSAYISSDSLPDIFLADTATANDLIKYGMIMDYASLLAECGPNILADGEARLTFGINTNGAVYGLPHHQSYPMMMSVRRDWMRNLGYEVGDDAVIQMTIGDFTKLMHEFTENDPDGDGQKDTFGICAQGTAYGMFAPIFTAFDIPMSGAASCYYDAEANSVYTWIKHPNFLSAIELMREFYQYGLMDTEFAVVADASTEFAYLWNSTAGAAGWAPPGMTNNWLGRYTEEGVGAESFVYVDITGDDGANGGYIASYDGMWVCLSSKCKDPASAVKLMDYLYSEDGQITAYLGIEDVHFTWTDKAAYKYKMTEAYADMTSQRADGGWYIWNVVHGDSNIERKSLTKITVDAINYGTSHLSDTAAVFYGTTDEISALGTTLTDLVNEMFANLIVTDGDYKAMYQDYLKEYDQIGGLVYEAEATKLYLAEHGM